MVRRSVLPAALVAFIGATTMGAAQEVSGSYADGVALERVRHALASSAPRLVVPPLPPPPTFRVQVFGRRPFVQPFDEWMTAALTPAFTAPQGEGLDVLPLIRSAVTKYKTARARKQVAGELAEFLRTHPSPR